jgi:hypothetical protein
LGPAPAYLIQPFSIFQEVLETSYRNSLSPRLSLGSFVFAEIIHIAPLSSDSEQNPLLPS